MYLDKQFDGRGCFRNNATRFVDSSKTIQDCISSGYTINNTIEVAIPDLRNDTFAISRSCNASNEEILINLMNPLMDVNQINASVSSENLPNDTLDAYLASTCGNNPDCGKTEAGNGLYSYETSYKENVTIWMICLGDPVLNTTLNIQASYLRNWTEPVEDEMEGLSRGGIAGIVIACVVAFLFIVGLMISLKGTIWFKNLFSCCKNKT